MTLSIFTTAWALSAFLFWFLLGALVNSDSFLPYAAMLGSVVFVVGYLWMNFLSSRVGREFVPSLRLLYGQFASDCSLRDGVRLFFKVVFLEAWGGYGCRRDAQLDWGRERGRSRFQL